MVAAGGPGGVRVPADARTTLVEIIANVMAATAAQRIAIDNTFLEIAGLFIVVSFFYYPLTRCITW
jgi:hypothetical protein